MKERSTNVRKARGKKKSSSLARVEKLGIVDRFLHLVVTQDPPVLLYTTGDGKKGASIIETRTVMKKPSRTEHPHLNIEDVDLSQHEDYITTAEASEIYEIDIDVIRNLCRAGILEAIQNKRRWYISPQSIEKFLKNRKREHDGNR